MQVILKDAATYARKALAEADRLSFANTVDISIYSDKTVEETVTLAREEARATMHKAESLIIVGYGIRKLIGKANQEHGINDAMNERELLKARMGKIAHRIACYESSLLRGDDALKILNARFVALREQPKDGSVASSMRRETLSANIWDKSDVESDRRELAQFQAEESRISTQIARVNLTKTITLDEVAVRVLRDSNIIVG